MFFLNIRWPENVVFFVVSNWKRSRLEMKRSNKMTCMVATYYMEDAGFTGNVILISRPQKKIRSKTKIIKFR